jgi:signal transduction histidine kinase/CheY-like chemotaxis protein
MEESQDIAASSNDIKLSRMREFNFELDRLMREQFYSSKTTNEFLIEVAKAGSRALGVKRISIWTYTENRQAIRCQCLYDEGYRADAYGMLLNARDYPRYFHAISQSRVVSAHLAQTNPSTSEFTETYLQPLNIKSMLDAHIPSSTGVRGVLCCESVGRARDWAVDEQSFAASLAEFVGLALDRAERLRTQEQLAIALRAAEKAGEAQSAFLANMSHEIRTPMNGILGMLEMVLGDEQDPSKREKLEIAHNSAKGLLKVLDDVLDYSRLEAGEFSVTLESYDLGKIVTEVTRLFQARAEQKGIALSVVIEPALPGKVIGDPVRVRQVLSNFVSNALKFTEKGTIDVLVQCELSGAGDVIRIEVRDTGIGIAEASLSKLFQRFFQVDISLTRRFGGAGLGLVICKQLVDLMGGNIGVESKKNKGSCFWFTLPMNKHIDTKPAEDTVASAQAESLPSGRVLNVLAAEDNRVNRCVIQAMVTSLGHSITLVENGEEVLNALDSGRFDIILMDIQMPVLDGLSATKRIRSRNGSDRDITIIALTANAMTTDRERYLAAGMNDYLAKPITRGQLIALFN